MSLLSESFLCRALKFLSAIFCALPSSVTLPIARAIGFVLYYLLPKKRMVVKTNLKIALANQKVDPQRIPALARESFMNITTGFMDLLRLPRITKDGIGRMSAFIGKENVAAALAQGKGCILLAMHQGNWELASVIGSTGDYVYNVVANEQKKSPLLSQLLNDYRRLSGAKTIPPGSATRDIIRALDAKEVVSLVLDQGGKTGVPVDFLGKTASMSTGALRLARKYGTPVCPVWLDRLPQGKYKLTIYPAMELQSSDNVEADIRINAQRASYFFEPLMRRSIAEYMWFYKVYKYSDQADVFILDDGKVGHLRQSQAVLKLLEDQLDTVGKTSRSKTIPIEFYNIQSEKFFACYCFLAQFLGFLVNEKVLKIFLRPQSYEALAYIKPDYIISCGSKTAGVSLILSRLWKAKNIHILKPSILSQKSFSLDVLPQHDKPKRVSKQIVLTKVALNLITPTYLKEQETQLFLRYSHLKNNVRSKIGVLIGGNTKGVVFDPGSIRSLIRQLKDAAEHFNMDLLVTTSRRTPAEVDEVVVKELRNFDRCALLVIANESNIPEAVGGILALSDLLIVSGESISMVSEAVSSGKKTVVFAPNGTYSKGSTSKYDHFVLELSAQGHLAASSIKDITVAINQAMGQKINVKHVDDKRVVSEAIRGIIA